MATKKNHDDEPKQPTPPAEQQGKKPAADPHGIPSDPKEPYPTGKPWVDPDKPKEEH